MSSIHLLVDLDPARPGPEGRVKDDEESAGRPFSGWLELMQIVEQCRAGEPLELRAGEAD